LFSDQTVILTWKFLLSAKRSLWRSLLEASSKSKKLSYFAELVIATSVFFALAKSNPCYSNPRIKENIRDLFILVIKIETG